MTQSDSQILINQTRWFQVCTFLLVTIGSMAVYDYVQEKKTNRQQQIQISENKQNIAVLKYKEKDLQKWREGVDNKFEKVRYKE